MAMSNDGRRLLDYIFDSIEEAGIDLEMPEYLGIRNKINDKVEMYEMELIAETRRILLEVVTEAIERAYVEGQ